MNKDTNSTTKPKSTKTQTKATIKKPVAKKPIKVEEKTFNKDDLIPCVSVTVGPLIYSALDTRSHNRYDWFDFGDVCDVEYQDLLAMIARKSEFVFMPRFVIDDDDFLKKYPKLKEIKEKFFGLDNPTQFFGVTPDKLEEKINSAPEGLKKAIADMAGTLIKQGELDSRKKIEIIDRTLGTEFAKLVK